MKENESNSKEELFTNIIHQCEKCKSNVKHTSNKTSLSNVKRLAMQDIVIAKQKTRGTKETSFSKAPLFTKETSFPKAPLFTKETSFPDPDPDSCKICFTSKNTLENPLITPCKCKSEVHKLCIEKWRRIKLGKKQYYRCEVCLHKYMISIFSNKYLFYAIRFLYFNLAKLTPIYHIFNTVINFLFGYSFYKKFSLINKFSDNIFLISEYYTYGLIINLLIYLLITFIFILSMTISKRKNLYWKDSDNIDIRFLCFINFMNLIFISLKNIFSILSIFSMKITLNYLIEFCLKDCNEILNSEFTDYNNLLDVFYLPEFKNYSTNQNDEEQINYNMINEI